MDVLSQSEIDNLLRRLLNDASVLPESPAAETASVTTADNAQKSNTVFA